MPEAPRAQLAAGARSGLALAVEPGAQRPARTLADQALDGTIAKRTAALQPIEDRGPEGQDRVEGPEDPCIPPPAAPGQRPGVLVMNGPRDHSAAPAHVLGRGEGALDPARRQIADRTGLPRDAERLEHQPLDRPSRVPRPHPPRERF